MLRRIKDFNAVFQILELSAKKTLVEEHLNEGVVLDS